MSYLNPPYFNASFLGRLIVQSDFVIEKMKAILETTFLNYLNWIMRKAPVPTRQDCMALRLPLDESTIAEQRDEEMIQAVESLFAQTDQDYKRLLEPAGYGDALFCAARKPKR